MSEDEKLTPRQARRKIPKDAVPAVVDWLNAQTDKAIDTAVKLRRANRNGPMATYENMALYWSHVAAACGLLASQLRGPQKNSAPEPTDGTNEPTDDR